MTVQSSCRRPARQTANGIKYFASAAGVDEPHFSRELASLAPANRLRFQLDTVALGLLCTERMKRHLALIALGMTLAVPAYATPAPEEGRTARPARTARPEELKAKKAADG